MQKYLSKFQTSVFKLQITSWIHSAIQWRFGGIFGTVGGSNRQLALIGVLQKGRGKLTYAKTGQQVVSQASILDYDKDNNPPEPHSMK